MDIWFFSKCIDLGYLFLFAIYLLFKDNRLNKGNYFLAAFLIVESISILNTFLWHFYPYTHIHLPYLYYIDDLVFYLRGTSIYLYIKSYTNENFKINYKHLIHLLPFTLASIFFFSVFHRYSITEKIKILEDGLLTRNIMFSIDITLHVVIVFYLILSAIEIYRYKFKLKNAFSEFHKVWLNWTSFLVGGFFVIMIVDFNYMIVFFTTKKYPHFIVNIIDCLVFSLTVLIMFKGLRKPEIFAFISENNPAKYSNSKLKESDRIMIKNKLDQLLYNDKIYCEPSVSIKDIADKIGVLPKHLSQVINEDYKHNFFDLINGFRIEEAKILLTKYSNEEKNVIEILYATGFNSKTTFNLAFKKHTGHTPTSYRRLYTRSENLV